MSQGDGLGYLLGFPAGPDVPGFSYVIPAGANGKIQQGAYQDFFGAPITNPGASYIFRMKCAAPLGGSAPTITADFYSPSMGAVIATCSINIANISLTWQWANFSAPLPAVIPTDMVLRVYSNGQNEAILDDLEIIDSDFPVLYDQMRLSYFQNPFGYDSISGVLSVDPSENLTSGVPPARLSVHHRRHSLFQTQNNGTGEPDTWDVTQYVGVCGCSGPNAVDFGEEFAIWAGSYGRREFTGDPSAAKISQEFSATWESINWTAQRRSGSRTILSIA